MDKSIDLSIIIPVYNTEQKLLEKCLSSFCGAKNFSYEILVIDDGSREEYQIESISKRFDFVRYFKQKNSGASAARNFGLEIARGRHILFVDSDDAIYFEVLDNFYMTHKDDVGLYDAVCFGYRVIENGKVTCRTNQNHKTVHGIMGIDKDRVKGKRNNGYNCGVVWSKLYRKAALADLRFNTNLRYAEDLYFNISFDLMQRRVLCVNDCLYDYYVNNSSIGHRYNELAGIQFNSTICEVLKLFDDNNFPEERYQNYYWTVLIDYFITYIYRIYGYNKSVKKSSKIRKREMNEVLSLPGFKRAMENLNLDGVGTAHRYFYRLIKSGNYKFAHFLVELKRKIR